MGQFQYEWWTVSIKDQTGTNVWEFKAKSKDHAVKQIQWMVKYSNSEANLNQDCWHRRPRIVEVYWETLALDRKGYQRQF